MQWSGKNDACEGDHGLLPHVSGEVRFGEHVINGMRSHEIARLGIGLVPQGRWIFPKLTVRENLMMGTAAAGDAEILEEVFEYFPVLKTRLATWRNVVGRRATGTGYRACIVWSTETVVAGRAF